MERKSKEDEWNRKLMGRKSLKKYLFKFIN